MSKMLFQQVKALSKVFRQDSSQYLLNNAINNFEFRKLLSVEVRKTELSLLAKSTKKEMFGTASAQNIQFIYKTTST